jgi:hypothetical protein
MRGFRLNGWQRIGIAVSVLWFAVGHWWAELILFGEMWGAGLLS